MKNKIKISVLAIMIFCIMFVLCGFSYVEEGIVIPSLDSVPPVYTAVASSDDGYVDTVPFSSEYANYGNGYDSDPSPIKVVPVYEVDAGSVSFLNKDLSSYDNPNTKGWFYFCGPTSIAGLPISGPLMQARNNEYYLTRDENDKYSYEGSIYADYRNDLEDIKSNRNIVIYAHARGPFGGLKYLDNAARWWSDANNHFIKITTDTECSVWQVFSWYETTADYDYRRTFFSSGSGGLARYASKLQDNNEISALKKIGFSDDDTILTLSTCKGSDKNVRVAVHAVLVKCEKR